jgi:sugar lactone lactonase YvrE
MGVMIVGNTSVGFFGGVLAPPDVFDVSASSYDTKTLLTSGETTTNWGLTFSADGTKAYVTGTTENKIFQYTLGTPWDVSTGSYASKSLDFTTEDGTPRGITFSADGTKLYVCGNANNRIFQYTLGTAWDVSTASYASKSLDLSSQSTSPNGLAINSTGTTLFVVTSGVGKPVLQYTLSTPWDMSTATYASKTFAISEDTNPNGMAVSSDGYTLFIMGGTGFIFQYDLGTAWDASTGSYASLSLDVTGYSGQARGVALGNDDAKIYYLGNSNRTVYQFTMG